MNSQVVNQLEEVVNQLDELIKLLINCHVPVLVEEGPRPAELIERYYECVYIYIYIMTYIYIYTHIYIYIYTQKRRTTQSLFFCVSLCCHVVFSSLEADRTATNTSLCDNDLYTTTSKCLQSVNIYWWWCTNRCRMTVSDQNNVRCILNNWCIRVNLSCGKFSSTSPPHAQTAPLRKKGPHVGRAPVLVEEGPSPAK